MVFAVTGAASAQTSTTRQEANPKAGTPSLVMLQGNLNPKAKPQFDEGPVDPGMKMSVVTVAFKKTPAQQAALEKLLAEQQDRTSANYHRWLTPEQYADRFGVNAKELQPVLVWLQSQGLTISHVARSRNWLTVSGTAKDVEAAFHTQIHHFYVDGEEHYASITEPSVPAEFEPLVRGILGLDDFHPKAPRHRTTSAPMSHGNGSAPRITNSDGSHNLGPGDIATIYDITRLYQMGFNGYGQKIVVIGQSDINLSDIASFQANFLLPYNAPILVLYGDDPGMGSSDNEEEADLDIEWVGAVAQQATIIYVYSTDAPMAAEYAISEALAPIVSYSIGACETTESEAMLNSAESTAQQGDVQGITWVVSAGDAGAAGCDRPSSLAKMGVAVEFPADVPEVTAVGGTMFNDSGGVYWNPSYSPYESALSYIPEVAWNESTFDALAASGGGLSTYFSQPSWQVGPGVHNWGWRGVPDVALDAAYLHDPYVIFTQGQMETVGGTSAATPVFAGMLALLNQSEGTGQGNINLNLYRLAQTNVFHDITSGSNIVPCQLGTPDCTTGSFGYSAGIGYDLVTGLGSIDAYNLVAGWNAQTPVSNAVLSCTPNPVYERTPNAQGYGWLYTLTLTETVGVGTSITGITYNGTALTLSDYVSPPATLAAYGMISIPLQSKDLSVPTSSVFGLTGVDAGGRQWSDQVTVQFDGNTAPFGYIDTPANNTTGVAGAIGVTGWALSGAGIQTVAVWRAPVPSENPNALVYIGNADIVDGSRPDIAIAYPGYPGNSNGWGLQVLTNELPNASGQGGVGNGTYNLHVLVTDNAGNVADIGTRTITVNNTASVLPFGTIDTPTQGGTESGTFVNFGWVVTPQPNLIPLNGSTIWVFIDNVRVGNPVYNNYRVDIASLFPGLQNSNGAVGYYYIDTTQLTNGLHTIAWVATDSAGHAAGLGSRYFNVHN
jgi:subtilase family serine protease